MNNLTIDEVRKKKQQAESEIAKIISNFISETDVNIVDISHEFETLGFLDEASKSILISFNLHVEV